MADETNLRAAGEEDWGKACVECGKTAQRHASLYDKAEGDTVNLGVEKPVGEVFIHDAGVKCVRLTTEYREKVGLEEVAR